MLKCFLADLHLHTALSPCGDEAMTPHRILAEARDKEIDLVAITDHNSAENIAAVLGAAQQFGITVIPGMEVQTREEVHLICLFPGLAEVLDWQAYIYQQLPLAANRAEYFGRQLLFDADSNLTGQVSRLLLTSTSLTVEQVVQEVSHRNGICYPAHIDRSAYSIISNLGFFPPDLDFPAAEISGRISAAEARVKYPELHNIALVGSSDAHHLTEIDWPRTEFWLEEPVLSELLLAFRGRLGRKVVTI